jgi:hypothetical protein
VPQPPGLYGPLLYPTSILGTAGLTLDFTVVHPVGRRGTEYACDENTLHRAYRAKVTKHHEWLQAKNYWFVPVVAATSGTLHPETLRLLYDFARLKTDVAEQHAVANSLRSPMTPEQLCQRRGATFARLRMEAQLYSLRASATRLTGKYWAAPYASSLLPRSRARAGCGIGGFCPGSCGPGTFLLCPPTVFRSAICDCLSINGCFSLRLMKDIDLMIFLIMNGPSTQLAKAK